MTINKDSTALPLRGEAFVNVENEAGDERTEQFVLKLARFLGLTDRRPKSVKKILRCLADILVAINSTKTGLFCMSGKAGFYTGKAYAVDIAMACRDALLNARLVYLLQPSRHGVRDATSTVYRARRELVSSGLVFRKHEDVGPLLVVRGRRPKIFAGRKAKRKAEVIPLSYFAMADTERMVRALRTIHAVWVKHPLTSAAGEQWSRATRTMNNCALDEGGRLIGHWQNRKSIERLTYTIDGQPICEVDVRGSYLFLAYRMTGGSDLNLGPDPYRAVSFVRERPEWRKLAKALVAAMLCSSPHRKTFPKGKLVADGRTIPLREQYAIPKNLSANYFFQQIREAFPFMNTLGGSGLSIMFEESEVIIDAIHTLATRKNPVVSYPVHDCLMCKREDQDVVVKALQDSFFQRTGGIPYLEIEYCDKDPLVVEPTAKPNHKK